LVKSEFFIAGTINRSGNYNTHNFKYKVPSYWGNKDKRMKIVITNTKGGSSKSTTAFQVAAAYFLAKKLDVTVYEFDDENQDSKVFNKSLIKSEQMMVGDGREISSLITPIILDKAKNAVLDIGGNKTTTLFIDALKKSRMSIGIDLFIIPMSGGSQDLQNAKKTYDLIKEFNKPIIFCLSRSRSKPGDNRIFFQYGKFFSDFKDANYFILQDSDCIDLSRMLQKSVFEIAGDKKTKESLEGDLVKAFEKDDDKRLTLAQQMIYVSDESEVFSKECLLPAFKTIDSILNAKK